MAVTEKTIREFNQWVKITRDSQKRKFTFARGYEGSISAHEVEIISFAWVPTWKEALEGAKAKMQTYA